MQLSSHIEQEKIKIVNYYDHLKAEILKMIDDKRNDALSLLNDQLETLQFSLNLLKYQSEAIFNGRCVLSFESLDKAITKVNQCSIEKENDLAIFIQTLNNQIKQRRVWSFSLKN